MKTYELTYIITSDISLEEAEAIAKDIESSIQAKGGAILKQTTPSAKTLAFPIKKKGSGFFGSIEFSSEENSAVEIQESLKKDTRFLRHMVVIKKPIKQKRGRKALLPTTDKPSTKTEIVIEKPVTAKPEPKSKIELEDIQQKLDEILGE